MSKILNKILKDEELLDDELIKSVSDIKLKELLKIFISHLKNNHKLNSGEIADLFGKKIDRKESLPISIFNNEELSCLETVVKFLKEDFNLKNHEIALLLNRNDRTIWATYNIACKKRKEKLIVKESERKIPISIFTERKLSVLEAIVGYLKEQIELTYSEVSRLLNRDSRNIWTIYNRYKLKNEK